MLLRMAIRLFGHGARYQIFLNISIYRPGSDRAPCDRRPIRKIDTNVVLLRHGNVHELLVEIRVVEVQVPHGVVANTISAL